MSDPSRWTDAAGIASAARRRWNDGTLLRAFVAGDPFPRIEVPLRGPSAADLGDHFDAARAWAEGVRAGRGYSVVEGRIGGRLAGATDVPVRAVVDSYQQAWELLRVRGQAEAFAALVSVEDEALANWALAHPLQALELEGDWSALRAAHAWLRENRGSGLHLRQVDAPGVDTKFIERHRRVLAVLLDVSASSLASDLGLAIKPSFVRLRFDEALFGMPSALHEGMFRVDEVNAVQGSPARALIVENEVTYLSVPVPTGGVVIWGRGYGADERAALSWLADVPTDYWGDLDTHGFAILNQVRRVLPQTRSLLMDRETLLAHEDRWGSEPKPTNAALRHLTATEHALYSDLVTDRYGTAIRLEQERIDWAWALARL
ncbi:MAG: DUF2220 family protein [Microbacterium sp.]